MAVDHGPLERAVILYASRMTSDYLHAIVTLLAIMNPLDNAPIFLQIVQGLPVQEQLGAACKATVAIFVILVVSALVGKEILLLFGISLDAFRVAGGLAITYMGFSMLSGSHSKVQRSPEDEDIIEQVLVPFAMPMVAVPGTITVVITLAISHSAHGVPLTALVASAVGTLTTYVALVVTIKIGNRLSAHTQRVVMRFMGLILVAMGVQFILVGVRSFMAS